MKNLLRVFVSLIVFTVFAALYTFSVEIKDVDSTSWAYKSIQKLVSKGYIAVYEGGEFRGDLPVSRTVFAAALGKLIDQIESGEIKVEVADLREIKKLGNEFKNEISDYDTRLTTLEKRIGDIESGKVVIQKDVTKIAYDLSDSVEKLTKENEEMKNDLGMLTNQVKKLSEDFQKSEAQRKKMQTITWIGILGALVAGLAD